MKNWKTTLCGLIAAIGVYLSGVPELETVGKVLGMIGAGLGGFFASDAKPNTTTAAK
jgi:hypothetical protein